jgi:hypothetical protein
MTKSIQKDTLEELIKGIKDLRVEMTKLRKGEGLVTFKEGRIRLAAIDLPLETNFGRGGMKKLVEDQTGRGTTSRGKEAESYHVQVSLSNVGVSTHASTEVMIRGAQTIKNITGWDDPVDANSIRAFLGGVESKREPKDAFVEVKRGKVAREEETEEPASKKKPPNGRGATSGEGPTICICHRERESVRERMANSHGTHMANSHLANEQKRIF